MINMKSEFPDSAVSILSKMENAKRQYYRPVYSIHKWWARRSGTVFRSVGLYALGEKYKEGFLQIKRRSIDPKSQYFSPNIFHDRIILDPFMGGGVTLIEMARMGVKVIGVDLNPLAWWIVKQALVSADLDKLNESFDQLDQTVGREIKSYYTTTCGDCGSKSIGIYYFWSTSLNCATCSNEVFLFRRCFINKGMSRTRKKDNIPLLVCPNCLSIFFASEKIVTCPTCGYGFDPNKGTVSKGVYTCINCGSSHRIIDTLKATQSKFNHRMYAIEYYCDKCDQKKYKPPDQKDLELYESASEEFEKEKKSLLFPQQEIPRGRDTTRIINHNFAYFSDLFNKRQLLCLSKLLKAIISLQDPHARDLLLTTFSNSLEYNNMLVFYNYPHRKIHHLFTHHAIPVTTRPVENNVWGCKKHGAGSFVMVYKRTLNAKRFINKPFEKYKSQDGFIRTIYLPEERIEAKFAKDFSELRKESNVLLLCKDSRDLSEIEPETIDYVITDPPYFDNINYSELSNFFYVWLRLALKDRIAHFEPEYVPKLAEIVCDERSGKNMGFYEKGLTEVFSQCKRALKPDGRLIFTYHHTSDQSWGAVLNAVVNSGFQVEDIFVVESEPRFNPHLRGKKGIQFDAIIECKKEQASVKAKMKLSEFKDQLHSETLKSLKHAARGFSYLKKSDFAVFALAECFKIYSQTRGQIFDSNDKKLPVKNIIKAVEEIQQKLHWNEIMPFPEHIDPLTFIYVEFLSQNEMSREELAGILRDYGKPGIEDFLENELIELIDERVHPSSPSNRLGFLKKQIESGNISLIDQMHFLMAQDNEKNRAQYYSIWNMKRIREISDRLYLKTGNPSYARLSEELESLESQRTLSCF